MVASASQNKLYLPDLIFIEAVAEEEEVVDLDHGAKRVGVVVGSGKNLLLHLRH